MRELEEKILQDGKVFPGNILKVDSFLNHQIDVEMLDKMADEFYRLYKDDKITRILTIEASGIAVAVPIAQTFPRTCCFRKESKIEEYWRGCIYFSCTFLHV